ncbi:hypothetical protein, partial [Streptosporangium amethystogenes]
MNAFGITYPADVVALVEGAARYAPVIGTAVDGRPVVVDLNRHAHALIGLAAGGGATSALRALAPQLHVAGAALVVCDIKRIGHRWARGQVGVTHAVTLPEIYDAVMELANTLQQCPGDDIRRVLLVDAADSVLSRMRDFTESRPEPWYSWTSFR